MKNVPGDLSTGVNIRSSSPPITYFEGRKLYINVNIRKEDFNPFRAGFS
jgi:hypothetical protein